MDKKPNVFISWSRDYSSKVAEALADFLRHINSEIRPFVSTNIQKGQLGIQDIHNAMNSVKCGISCITTSNQRNPWLQYEAGYLTAKTKALCPLLIDFEEDQFPVAPLNSLQFTRLEKNDVQNLVNRIITKLGFSPDCITAHFDTAWQAFEPRIKKLIEENRAPIPSDLVSTNSQPSELTAEACTQLTTTLMLMRSSLSSLNEQAPASVDALGTPFKKSKPYYDCLKLLIHYENQISSYPSPEKISDAVIFLRHEIKELSPWVSIYNQWTKKVANMSITDIQKDELLRLFFNMLKKEEQALLSLYRLAHRQDKYYAWKDCKNLPAYSAQAGLSGYFLQIITALSAEEAHFHVYTLATLLCHGEAMCDLTTNEKATLNNFESLFYGHPELVKEVTESEQ